MDYDLTLLNIFTNWFSVEELLFALTPYYKYFI